MKKIICFSSLIALFLFIGRIQAQLPVTTINNNIKNHALTNTLYKKPTPDAKIIGKVTDKNKIIVIEKKNQWAKILDSGTGTVGWIFLGDQNEDDIIGIRLA